jgi:hypothetical protein
MLEENLMKHATLSVGDLLTVWYRGEEHKTRVVDARPADAGCLVDTNVEVDLDVSEEYQNQVAVNDASIKASTSSSSGFKLGVSTSEAPVVPRIIAAQQDKVILPPEPASLEGSIECRIKTPAGRLLQRRFHHRDLLVNLFHYCTLELGSDLCSDASKMQLNTRFPRRLFTISDTLEGKTFEDVGLTSTQELFLLSVVC